MRRVLPSTWSVVLLAAAFTGCAGPMPIPSSQLDDPGALIFNGYSAAQAKCFHCHGADGSGTIRGPDLQQLVPYVGDARIWDQIENGDAIMPAYKNKLTQREIAQVVSWMRAGFPAAAGSAGDAGRTAAR
ncbi:MAG: cytochrome c [Deltaproteobacteria bacterium]|nr:cytochrome c [Deltaproteobacteria bacterium]